MAQQYQFKEHLEIPVDSVRIQNIILVGNAKAAELFLEKIFPHYTECFVVSADGAYPRNEALREKIHSKLASNRSLVIAIFGADSFRSLSIASERILVLDRLIADCFSQAKIKSHFRRDVDEFDIVRTLVSFFDQWRITHRSGNYSYQLRTAEEFERERMGWLLDLVAPQSEAPEARVMDYQIEDLEKLNFYSSSPASGRE